MFVDPNLPFRRFRYDHKATWTIKNFHFRQDHVQIITSPEFDVRCLDVTTWSFQLYPKTNRDYIEFSVRLHYNANPGIGEVPITSVEFAIYLIDANEGKWFHAEGCFCPNSSEPTSTPIQFVPLKDFRDWRHLQNGSFVVVCKLTTWFNHQEFTSSVYRNHFVSLSNCVRGMMDLPYRYDVLAFSREKKEFKVHRCVLQARCPMIFHNSLDMVQNFPVLLWYSSISTVGLRILLSYLYGEIKIEVPNHVKLELMSVATRYQLKDLERKLREYPLNLVLETEIIVKNITVKLSLKDGIWDNMNEEHIYKVRIEPTKKLSVSLLKVSFSSDGTNLEICFSINFLGKVPIHLRCSLFIQDKNGKVLYGEKYCHLFTDITPWSVTPPYLTKRAYYKTRPRALMCNVRLSEGSFEDRYSPNQNPRIVPGRCILINNLLELSRDLRFMYENRLNCDLKIIVGEHEFFGHKCFLEERSTKIARRLGVGKRILDIKDGMVILKLDSISPHICRIALQYMYCGTIDACDIETANSLKKAADYFLLPLLEEASLAEEWLTLRPFIKQAPDSNPDSDVVVCNGLESTLDSKSLSNHVTEKDHTVISLAELNQYFKKILV